VADHARLQNSLVRSENCKPSIVHWPPNHSRNCPYRRHADLQWKSSMSTPLRHTMGIQVEPHSFLTLAPDWGEWSTSCPCHFIPEKQMWYPQSRKMGGPQSQSGCFKKRE